MTRQKTKQRFYSKILRKEEKRTIKNQLPWKWTQQDLEDQKLAQEIELCLNQIHGESYVQPNQKSAVIYPNITFKHKFEIAKVKGPISLQELKLIIQLQSPIELRSKRTAAAYQRYGKKNFQTILRS